MLNGIFRCSNIKKAKSNIYTVKNADYCLIKYCLLKKAFLECIIKVMDMTIYLLKFFWYILKYLIIGLFVGAIMIVGFFVARDIANVYIIVNEGMEVRAGNIMNISQISEIDKYYVENYAVSDFELSTNRYDEFFIRDFEYKLKIESLWANPWEDTAFVKAVETVPDIDGEYPVENDDEVALVLPEWQSARYAISLVRIDGAWYINQVVKLEDIQETVEGTEVPVN